MARRYVIRWAKADNYDGNGDYDPASDVEYGRKVIVCDSDVPIPGETRALFKQADKLAQAGPFHDWWQITEETAKRESDADCFWIEERRWCAGNEEQIHD